MLYALLIAVIAGCGVQSSRVSDDLTIDKLAKDNSGVAIMQMGLGNSRCPGGNVTIGTQVAGGYEVVKTLLMRNTFIDKGVPPQVKLKPGTYHIIAWGCQRGNMIQSVGKPNSSFFEKQRYPKSFASFTVNPGEVVNVGMLRMHQIGLLGLVNFEVTDLPPDLHAGLKKARPKLYAQMTTRLMKANNKPLTEKQRNARCKFLKILQGINKNQALPSYCSGA